MCGRFKLTVPFDEIVRLYNLTRWPEDEEDRHRYNIAPTDKVAVITAANGERSLELMRWGLVPWWAKDLKVGFSSINARADTVATKPAFRDAWKAKKRCLVLSDGWYEWRKPDKQPFCLALGKKGVMCFAGLWAHWKPKDGGEPVRSCTITTTAADIGIGDIHDRMPVIRDDKDVPAWLGKEPIEDPAALLQSFPTGRLKI